MPVINRLSGCFLAALGLLVAGCSSPEPPPLRVGINPWPAHDLLWIADQKGYFRELGLEVRLEQFPGLADTAQAMNRDKLDVAALTIGELAMLGTQRAPFWVLDESIGLDAIVGGPGVETLADLKGKRIGIEPDSAAALVLHTALEQAGLSPGDVDVVQVAQATGEEMLATGMVDALVTYPPVLMRVERQPGTRKIFDSSQMPGRILDVLVATPGVMARRKRELELLTQGYERALQLLRQHPEEVYALVARRNHLSLEEAQASFGDGIRFFDRSRQGALLADGGVVQQAIHQARVVVRQAPPGGN
jgi:NitT/TauT family transport system substrate-binding protein